MGSPRYTFLWWGDGYAIYEGSRYIGKDDQVSLVEMMEDEGIIRRYNAEAHFENEDILDDLNDYDFEKFTDSI